MNIENKTLYNLFQAIKAPYMQSYEYGLNGYGLYIEGFTGGVTVYGYNGALYRKTVYGENNHVFVSYIDRWQTKDGVTDTADLELMNEKAGKDKITEVVRNSKEIIGKAKFNTFTAKAKEFFKAVNAVDIINKGERERDIIISAHEGKIDIAGWNNEESGVWQLETSVNFTGAVKVKKKHLDGVKNAGYLEFSCMEYKNRLCLYIKGETEAVLPVYDIDPARFKEVLEYGYKKPEKEIKKASASTVINRESDLAKVLRKPRQGRSRKRNMDGWTWNSKKMSWTKACNW